MIFSKKSIQFIDHALKWIERNSNEPPPISFLKSKKNPPRSELYPHISYMWEGTISDLIEMAVAINEVRLIRNQAGELLTFAEIVRGLERLFNLKIPNIYSRRTRVMERKKNASPLLERMLALYKQEVEKLFQ